MFALEYPELAIQYTKHIRAAVAASTNNSHIVVSVGYEKASDVSLEGLPGPEQEASLVQKSSVREEH